MTDALIRTPVANVIPVPLQSYINIPLLTLDPKLQHEDKIEYKNKISDRKAIL